MQRLPITEAASFAADIRESLILRPRMDMVSADRRWIDAGPLDQDCFLSIGSPQAFFTRHKVG
jgi:hypothetical protein